MRYQLLGCAVALAAAVVTAQSTQKYCGDQGICFQVNVPSNGKDLFFQISGPSSMSWIGLGQGNAMAGSNIFLIYSGSTGTNVTLSTRLGTGHLPPQTSTSTQAMLLDGSMVTGDKMVANVKCSNCQSWTGGTMDFTSSSSSWIYGYKSGSAIKADVVTAPINKHDGFGTFQFDLSKATGGDGTVNPFAVGVSTSSSGNTSTSPTDPNNNITSTVGSSSGGDPTSVASSGDGTSSNEEATIEASTIAHGLMAAATFVLLFPTGGIIIRILPFKNVLWFHVGLQMLGYLVSLGVLETGIYIAIKNEELNYAHPVLGLIVICGLFLQPFLGLGHHLLYKRRGGPNVLTIPHVWWGRFLISLGIINGGLGLQLKVESLVLTIAYGIVAAVVWSTWMGLNLISYMRNKGQGERIVNKKAIRRVNSGGSEEMIVFPPKI